MTIPYEKILAEDLNIGVGAASVTSPQGGTLVGNKIGLHTFMGNVLSVKDYGAKGDYDPATDTGTDDTTAIQAAIAAAKTATPADTTGSMPSITLYFPPGIYLVSDSLFLGADGANNPTVKSVYAERAVIYSKAAGKPAIDWMSVKAYNCRGLIVYGNQGAAPSCGILLARANANGTTTGIGYFEDCYITGYYTHSALYSYASESNQYNHCSFVNFAGKAAAIITNTNALSMTSPNGTILGDGVATQASNTGNWFYGCRFDFRADTGGVATVETTSPRTQHFHGCYFNQGDGVTPLSSPVPHIYLKQDLVLVPVPGNQGRILQITNCLFHGNNYNECIEIQGTHNWVYITGNDFPDPTDGVTSILGDASMNLLSSVLEGNILDFSAANCDLRRGCQVRILDEDGTFSINSDFEGKLITHSEATTTLTTPTSINAIIEYYDHGEIEHYGRHVVKKRSFADGDETPSVSKGTFFLTQNSSPTTITDFDDGKSGQWVVVRIADNNTTFDFSASFLGNRGIDWTASSGDALWAIYDGTYWFCQPIRAVGYSAANNVIRD